MNRIDLINQYGTNKAAEKVNAKNELISQLDNGIKAIKALAPRMQEIYKTAVACLKNGIPLAPRENLRDSPKNCFITNGWSHYVGLLGSVDYFDGSTTLRQGFGKIGGGAFSWYLEINLEGEITRLDGDTLKDKVYVVTEFVNGFDAFESNFNKYLDDIVGKC